MEPQSLAVSTLGGRADLRLIAEKERQQNNREAVGIAAVQEARLLLEEGASPSEVEPEPEWLDRFWRLSQDISSEDLQSLWGRILARQTTGANTIGARTLEALGTLEGWEIAELTRIAPFVFEQREQRPPLAAIIGSVSTREEIKHELNARLAQLIGWVDRFHFGSIGLTVAGGFGFDARIAVDNTAVGRLWIGSRPFTVSPGGRPNETRNVGGAILFTQLGREIVGLIRTEPDPTYVEILTESLGGVGWNLTRSAG